MSPGRVVAASLGLLMFVAGLLFTLQGLGYLEGSSMTGSQTWALLGPALAGLGVALTFTAISRRGS